MEVRTRPLVRCTSVCSPPTLSICASVLPSPPLYIEVFLPPRRQLICAHTHILSSVYGNAVSRSAIKCTVMLVQCLHSACVCLHSAGWRRRSVIWPPPSCSLHSPAASPLHCKHTLTLHCLPFYTALNFTMRLLPTCSGTICER